MYQDLLKFLFSLRSNAKQKTIVQGLLLQSVHELRTVGATAQGWSMSDASDAKLQTCDVPT